VIQHIGVCCPTVYREIIGSNPFITAIQYWMTFYFLTFLNNLSAEDEVEDQKSRL